MDAKRILKKILRRYRSLWLDCLILAVLTGIALVDQPELARLVFRTLGGISLLVLLRKTYRQVGQDATRLFLLRENLFRMADTALVALCCAQAELENIVWPEPEPSGRPSWPVGEAKFRVFAWKTQAEVHLGEARRHLKEAISSLLLDDWEPLKPIPVEGLLDPRSWLLPLWEYPRLMEKFWLAIWNLRPGQLFWLRLNAHKALVNELPSAFKELEKARKLVRWLYAAAVQRLEEELWPSFSLHGHLILNFPVFARLSSHLWACQAQVELLNLFLEYDQGDEVLYSVWQLAQRMEAEEAYHASTLGARMAGEALGGLLHSLEEAGIKMMNRTPRFLLEAQRLLAKAESHYLSNELVEAFKLLGGLEQGPAWAEAESPAHLAGILELLELAREDVQEFTRAYEICLAGLEGIIQLPEVPLLEALPGIIPLGIILREENLSCLSSENRQGVEEAWGVLSEGPLRHALEEGWWETDVVTAADLILKINEAVR